MGSIVKICGITRIEDALGAIEAGADWLGFILRGESPRLLTAAAARALCNGLPAGVTIVAVMVSPTPAEALKLATEAGAARVQLHEVDSAAWPADFPLPAAFAVPVAADGALLAPLPPQSSLALLDTAHASRAGGTGRSFPWFVAATLAAQFDVMVAGGLDETNVGEMLRQVRPFGVDASSRLESSPGIKDAGKVRRFIQAVRAFDGAAHA